MAEGTRRSIEIPVSEGSGLEFAIQGLATRFENERLDKRDKEKQKFALLGQLAQVGMIKFEPSAKKGDPGTITIGDTTYTVIQKPQSILEQINSLKLKEQLFDNGTLRRTDTNLQVRAKRSQTEFLNTREGREQIDKIRFLGAANKESAENIEKAVRAFESDILANETRNELAVRELQHPTAAKSSVGEVLKAGGGKDGPTTTKQKNNNLVDILSDRILNFIPQDSKTKKLKFGGPQSKATFTDLLDTLTGVGNANASQVDSPFGTLGAQVPESGVGGPGGTVGQGQVAPQNQKQPPLVDINPAAGIAGVLGAVGFGAGQLGKARAGFKEAKGLQGLLKSIKPGVGPTIAGAEKQGIKSALLNLARGGGARGGGAARALVGGTALGGLGTAAGIGSAIGLGNAALESGVKLGGETIPTLRSQRALDASQGVNPRINEQQTLGNILPSLAPDPIGGIGELMGQIAGLTGFIPQVPDQEQSIAANQAAVRKNRELQQLLQQAQIPLSQQASRLQPQSDLGRLGQFLPNQNFGNLDSLIGNTNF